MREENIDYRYSFFSSFPPLIAKDTKARRHIVKLDKSPPRRHVVAEYRWRSKAFKKVCWCNDGRDEVVKYSNSLTYKFKARKTVAKSKRPILNLFEKVVQEFETVRNILASGSNEWSGWWCTKSTWVLRSS